MFSGIYVRRMGLNQGFVALKCSQRVSGGRASSLLLFPSFSPAFCSLFDDEVSFSKSTETIQSMARTSSQLFYFCFSPLPNMNLCAAAAAWLGRNSRELAEAELRKKTKKSYSSMFHTKRNDKIKKAGSKRTQC